MQVGDYVAKVTNDWEKHNPWMEFPNIPPEPFGMIVGEGHASWMWLILTADGEVVEHNENYLKVVAITPDKEIIFKKG